MRLDSFINQDNKQLILFFIICLVIVLFINLAVLVMGGDMADFDENIVLSFRNAADLSDPIGPIWVEELMRDITAFGAVGIMVFISLIVLFYMLIAQYKKVALIFFVAITSGIILSFSLKYGFTRPRPDLVPHGSYVYTSSFPSGHAMMSSLIYLTIAGMLSNLSLERRLKTYYFVIALILTISIGISRIYLGVHYLTDVIAGWLVGSGWALLTYFVVRYLKSIHWLGAQSQDLP